MKTKHYILSALLVCLSVTQAFGRTSFFSPNTFEYEINAGLNIGGATPLPIPAEIRKIESFDPDMNLSIGLRAIKMVDTKWGVSAAIRFELKGMETKASVKDYGMEIIQDDSRVSGRWTGKVQTAYHTRLLTIPITAVYRFNPKWQINFGPYLGIAMRNSFHGYVYEGYLREGDPTGEKAVFEGDARATYDFSDELRTLHFGLELGGRWKASNHLSVNAHLSWGLNDIFKSSFKTVTFDMYPIYVNLGFGYIF